MLKPLFKWTGGKNRMKNKYGYNFWPETDFKIFVDAFYGGGAVTHWVADKYPNVEFVINDQNTELVNLYKNLRDEPDWFCGSVAELEVNYLKIDAEDKVARKAEYNRVKMEYIGAKKMHPTTEAAMLYFLMKTSFNGWWKVYNYSNGRYSTPPGTVHHTKPFIDYELLMETSKFFCDRVLQINNFDFQRHAEFADSDTYYYFDPPYRDSTTVYTDDGFDDSAQIRLCEFMQYCDMHGAAVSMSNKDVGDGFWEHQLGNMEILEYDVKYTAGRGTTVNEVKEVLIRNFKPGWSLEMELDKV